MNRQLPNGFDSVLARETRNSRRFFRGKFPFLLR